MQEIDFGPDYKVRLPTRFNVAVPFIDRHLGEGRGAQSGAVTHHQLQSMWSVSLRRRNMRNSRPEKLTLPDASTVLDIGFVSLAAGHPVQLGLANQRLVLPTPVAHLLARSFVALLA